MIEETVVTVTDLMEKTSRRPAYKEFYSLSTHIYQDYREIVTCSSYNLLGFHHLAMSFPLSNSPTSTLSSLL